ncbi:MAG: reverse transcriptase domain-containing protein [Candidatus Thiodiazotropha sp.]
MPCGSRLNEELTQLKDELESGCYKPSPVRRVEIPKPGGKGIRLLGVPTVRDRVVYATLKALLEPIFEPLFSEHSYGFCPRRNQRQAVEAARRIVASGKPYVVDIDSQQHRPGRVG